MRTVRQIIVMKIYVFLFGLFWLSGITAKAADYYVMPTNLASAEPYTDWTIAGTNIIDVVNYAVANSGPRTVWVTNGTYLVTNQILMTNIITVQSFNGYSNTIVYADFPNYTTRVFSVVNTGIVDGFTISNGHWFESNGTYYGLGGGGAYIANALVRNCYFVNNISSNSIANVGGGGAYVASGGIISNCIFYANTAKQTPYGANYVGGGGFYLYYGTALKCIAVSNTAAGLYGGGFCNTYGTISNCTIIYNSGGQNLLNGGGLCIDSVISNNPSGGFNLQGGIIRNCTIVDNPAGCGVYVYSAGMVSNCVIAGNRSSSSAGGIYHNSAVLNIVSCSISNNICTGGSGGGGVTLQSNGKMINCLIANNTNSSSSGCGGGVLLTNTGSTFGLLNCTIVNNYSTTDGGGIAAGGNNYIANCIIAGNSSSAGIYPNVYNTGANSNNYWYCCANPTSAPLAPNQRNITNDPLFVDVNSGNYRLARGSPCINAGTNQGWMTSDSLDLAGNLRLRFGRVDIGAYEWYPRIKVNGVLYEKIKFINGTEPCQINGY